MRTLDTFNFGTSIKKWVCTFYTNIESAALNNGFLTKWFRPSRGVRQGCPLSPYLFILSAEIMANKVRQEPGFNGIKILGKELKLSQYADDTNLFCADLASVEKILEIVENFGNMAGLKLNRRKTKAIWLGRSGFILFSGLKIQGLFKDIPGRNSNFSSTQSCKKNAIRM